MAGQNEKTAVWQRRGGMKKKSLKVNVGTWNVRTLRGKRKLSNVVKEMKRLDLNVLDVSETRWEGAGDLVSDGFRVLFQGAKADRRVWQ